MHLNYLCIFHVYSAWKTCSVLGRGLSPLSLRFLPRITFQRKNMPRDCSLKVSSHRSYLVRKGIIGLQSKHNTQQFRNIVYWLCNQAIAKKFNKVKKKKKKIWDRGNRSVSKVCLVPNFPIRVALKIYSNFFPSSRLHI